ncbi:hypothetical protein CASFOL_042237 [Castilleja foliolosa]|uniref:Uncharacterized protein n=1 Tax=Castilleja foliolosa TaxID=1961234 RepID=A0ABD3BAF2_9LAMI
MASFGDIGVAAGINILFAGLFPKMVYQGFTEQPMHLGSSVSKFVNLDWRSYVRFLNWVPDALSMPEPELIDHAGLDSAVYLQIYLLGLKVFVPVALLAWSILVPVNWTNNTLAKALATDKWFWTHIVMAYAFTFWTCYTLLKEYATVAKMRLHFLASERRRPDQFTVLVRNVPPDPDESVSELVEHFFMVNHPNHYLTNQVVINANKLAELVNEKKSKQNWLDYYQIKYSRNQSKRPMTKTGFLGLCGTKVDVIDYQTAEIERPSKECFNILETSAEQTTAVEAAEIESEDGGESLTNFIQIFFRPVIALGFPLFASIRAIETGSLFHMRKLVTYWILFSLISLFEYAFVKIIEWIPFWSCIKLVVIFWLVIPHFHGLSAGGAPPRFLIIDDGWQQIGSVIKEDPNCVVQEGAQFANRLIGIEENAKFQKNEKADEQESGLKHVVKNAKQQHDVKIWISSIAVFEATNENNWLVEKLLQLIFNHSHLGESHNEEFFISYMCGSWYCLAVISLSIPERERERFTMVVCGSAGGSRRRWWQIMSFPFLLSSQLFLKVN